MNKLMKSATKRASIVVFLVLLTLIASSLIWLRSTAQADPGIPIQGAFAVTGVATPNTDHLSFCGGSPLDVAGEIHGNGFTSLGALSFFLQKTIVFPAGAMHGCLTLTAPNGDELEATYDGTEGLPNANGFISATGTLTFTGGTGRFQGAMGSAQFTATFLAIYPSLGPPVQVAAYYVIEGNVIPHGGD